MYIVAVNSRGALIINISVHIIWYLPSLHNVRSRINRMVLKHVEDDVEQSQKVHVTSYYYTPFVRLHTHTYTETHIHALPRAIVCQSRVR